MDLQLHDILELKKDHPCGSRRWEVLRVGMDIKLKCLGCGHEVMQPRRKVEKMIRRVVPKEEAEMRKKTMQIIVGVIACLMAVLMLSGLIVPYLGL